MAPTYDRQLIIGLERDAAINSTARILAEKNKFAPKFKTQVLWLDRATVLQEEAPAMPDSVQLKTAIARLTGKSRLYLIGHGDDTHLRVGGWSAAEVAKTLVDGGLRRVETVSLVACGAAGNPAVQWDQEEGAATFASQLATIFSMRDIETKLYARCYRVGAHAVRMIVPDWENPQERMHPGAQIAYQKRTRATADDKFIHKRPESKLMFRISPGSVEKSWVDYSGAHGDDAVGVHK
jgi:hypothetical protein